MNADGRTTSQQLYIPTLLVIGAGEALADRCFHAAESSGLVMKTCSAEAAVVAVPYRRPLAIVVPTGVFDRAADELEALVRDVRSALLVVDPHVSVRELEAMFAAAIDGSSAQRERREGAGRYSITEGLAEEAPFSRTTPVPPSRGPRSVRAPSSSRTPAPPRSTPAPPPSPPSGSPEPAPPRTRAEGFGPALATATLAECSPLSRAPSPARSRAAS
jgi:hypothetical protein